MILGASAARDRQINPARSAANCQSESLTLSNTRQSGLPLSVTCSGGRVECVEYQGGVLDVGALAEWRRESKGRSMRPRSGDFDSVIGTPESFSSTTAHGEHAAQQRSTNEGRRGRAPRRRSRSWSILDLIWSFGDYSSLSWSAKLRIEPRIVVAAHDGELLGQFLLEL